jgi:hypothetical protein
MEMRLTLVVRHCENKLKETLKDSYPSYQEYRMAEVDLWTEKRMAQAILNLINEN